MALFKQSLQRESRRNPRVGDKSSVRWHIKDADINGKARICNISESGVLLEARAAVCPSANSVLSFEAADPLPAKQIPAVGRLIWSKRKGLWPRQFLWGIEFIEPAQDVISSLHEKVKIKIERLKGLEKAVNVSGSLLLIAMIALAGYSLSQQNAVYRSYEESARLLLGTSAQQAELNGVLITDLQETRTVLLETETILAQTKEQNVALQAQVQGLQTDLQAVQAHNGELSKEVSVLQERLRPLEAEINSIEEGKSFSRAILNRLHAIKKGIHTVKRKAALARIAAQKERDQFLLSQGNQGYLIRDAKPQPRNLPVSESAKPEKKIKIDVEMVE